MVHVQHTPFAGGAVMAAFRLEDVAVQTVTTALVLGVAQMEAPEDGHLSRVSRHRLDEGPHKHDEEQVEKGQEGQNSSLSFLRNIL